MACSWKVEGMCCAEEASLLRREVGPLLRDPESLRFDLLRGVMIVGEDLGSAEKSRVVDAVARSGMYAVEVDGDPAAPVAKPKNRRLLVSTVAAAATTVIGILLMIVQPEGPDDTIYGSISTGLFIVASAIGLITVFPRALSSARRLRPDMNLLMSVAVVGAVIIDEALEEG